MTIETRLRIAGLIVALGLLIQLLSMLPVHPLAFIVFVSLGVPVMAAGVIFFLLSLVSRSEP
jgi:hypothetical protein